MIIDVKGTALGDRCFKIGTHGGIFHSDEVLGVAILDLVYEEEGVKVVRTRDEVELGKCDIVLDVGGGEYDHHKAGFNQRRDTGELYASAGLIWKNFGISAIGNMLMKMNLDMGFSGMFVIKSQIDYDYIRLVDMEDNGEIGSNPIGKHMFSFIPEFIPSYLDRNADFDKAFAEAEQIACCILRNLIVQYITKYMARTMVYDAMEKEFNYYKHSDMLYTGVIEIPSQNFPWLEPVTERNALMDNCVKFVIFPYPTGGWAAQCVPPSVDRKFEQLVPFPQKWAGKRDNELAVISDVRLATFCHNGCFFARAESKSAIIDMCMLALIEYRKKQEK